MQPIENAEYLEGRRRLKKRLELYTLAEYTIQVFTYLLVSLRLFILTTILSTRAMETANLPHWQTSCTEIQAWPLLCATRSSIT